MELEGDAVAAADDAADETRPTSSISRRRAIVAELERAASMQYPVEIDRGEGSWANWLNGFVLSVGDQWIVLESLIDNVYIFGYEVLRIDDITGVVEDDEGGFIERAVAALGRPPATFQLPKEAGVRDVLLAAAEHSKLISVHQEAAPDSSRLVGHLGHLGARKFELQEISAYGVWTNEPTRCWYKDVTGVSFGSRYETALERFGDERPTD